MKRKLRLIHYFDRYKVQVENSDGTWQDLSRWTFPDKGLAEIYIAILCNKTDRYEYNNEVVNEPIPAFN